MFFNTVLVISGQFGLSAQIPNIEVSRVLSGPEFADNFGVQRSGWTVPDRRGSRDKNEDDSDLGESLAMPPASAILDRVPPDLKIAKLIQ